MEITKQYRTETAHRLHLHEGRCKYIHGHSYLWEITVRGKVNEEGMVMDFRDLKLAVDAILDPFDHALVLSKDDPLLGHHRQEDLGQLFSDIGLGSRLITFPYIPTAENFAMYVGKELVDKGIKVRRVVCWETVNSKATWHWKN